MSEHDERAGMTVGQTEALLRQVDAAGRGDGAAACRLGDLYREGKGGVRCSPKQAYRWYAQSALMGDANGQNNVGACYEHGFGCEQSFAKAVKWYRLAAAQDLGTATMNLGYCTLRGHGLPADRAEALRLFRLAVEQGEEKARQEVERLEARLDGPKVRVLQGVRFEDRTQHGTRFGLLGLGEIPPAAGPDGAKPGDVEDPE